MTWLDSGSRMPMPQQTEIFGDESIHVNAEMSKSIFYFWHLTSASVAVQCHSSCCYLLTYVHGCTGGFRGPRRPCPPRSCQDLWLPFCYMRLDSRTLRRLGPIWPPPTLQSRSARAWMHVCRCCWAMSATWAFTWHLVHV